MTDPWSEWTVEPPLNFVVGATYIVRCTHDSGYWATFLVTVTEKTADGDYGFDIETMLDGSEGLVDGWDRGRRSD